MCHCLNFEHRVSSRDVPATNMRKEFSSKKSYAGGLRDSQDSVRAVCELGGGMKLDLGTSGSPFYAFLLLINKAFEHVKRNCFWKPDVS